MTPPLFTLNALADLRLHWKSDGKRVVFTNGCFDILHAGHVTYLTEAKSLGDVLVVGVNSDASVRMLKGEKRPIVPEEDRALLVAALKPVDAVVLFSESTPLNTLDALKPDFHVKGGDYLAETLPEYSLVTGYGGQVRILPFIEGCSTSGIIDIILSRYK